MDRLIEVSDAWTGLLVLVAVLAVTCCCCGVVLWRWGTELSSAGPPKQNGTKPAPSGAGAEPP